jgi:hypothetical protein
MSAKPLIQSFCLALFAFASGCGDPLNLGSNVLWKADHEGDGLAAWTADLAGGAEALGEPRDHLELSDERARSGRHSIKLIASAEGRDSGAVLWRSSDTLREAHYSAWFFVPRQYWTRTHWTIFNLQTRADRPNTATTGLSLNLRSLPDGDYVLYAFHHHGRYLQAPLADPPPLVSVGRWFHLAAFFRAAGDDSGRLTVWLDGKLVYDLQHRPTGGDEPVHWAVCNVAKELDPPSAELFVDDAVISLDRVIP